MYQTIYNFREKSRWKSVSNFMRFRISGSDTGGSNTGRFGYGGIQRYEGVQNMYLTDQNTYPYKIYIRTIHDRIWSEVLCGVFKCFLYITFRISQNHKWSCISKLRVSCELLYTYARVCISTYLTYRAEIENSRRMHATGKFVTFEYV